MRSLPGRRRPWCARFRVCCSAPCRRKNCCRRPLRSATAVPCRPRTPRMRCCAAAICVRRRWKGRASFRAAAAFWTFSPPRIRSRCAWSSGATMWTPWAFSTPRASGALSRWTAAASCRRRRPCRRCIRAAAPHWAKSCRSSPDAPPRKRTATRRRSSPRPCAPTGKSSAPTACSRRRTGIWASCTTRLLRRWTISRRRRPC